MVAPNLDGWFYDRLNNSSEFPYQELRLALLNNPIQITGSSTHSLEHVKNKRAVTFTQEDSDIFITYMRQCEMSNLDVRMFLRSARFIFNKNSRLVKDVNRVIDENRLEIDLIRKKYSDVFRVWFETREFK
jgi:hypothetical protein